MCGLAGIIQLDRSPVDPDLLDRMDRALFHRGPDDSGRHEEPGIGLVHRRLKIIDLSSAGRQPMTNEDNSLWLLFNGEIYNYQPLRAALIEKGHRFRSETDSEVLLHLYEEKGDRLVEDLRGMFVFAIWDRPRKRLLLARDRLGQKPLYYNAQGTRLVFASEMSGVLVDPAVDRSIDPQRIDDFLTYQYVPSPFTALQGVRKLEPGHTAVFDESGLSTQRYWSLSYEPKTEGLDYPSARVQVEKVLEEATRLRMIADVPLGAFLSGGIDSSAVVMMMARLSDRPVKTFSIGFEDADYSELAYARQVAERFSTDHQEFIVRPDAVSILPTLARHYGDPYADSSAIPTYYVAQMTQKHVTVALNGDGGDESFAGYERYRAFSWLRHAQRIPRPLLRIGRDLAGLFGEPTGRAPILRRAKRFFEYALSEAESPYYHMVTIFPADDRHRLYSPWMKGIIGTRDPWDYFRQCLARTDARDDVDRLLALDVGTYLPEDLLAKVDIATMMHGLESRSPFLDHVLMETVARFDSSFKFSPTTLKRLLKDMLIPVLGRELIARPKMGFGVPIGRWFRTELKDYVRDVLLDPRSLDRGYFDPAAIEALIHEHVSGARDQGYRLYALLMLELWHREVLES